MVIGVICGVVVLLLIFVVCCVCYCKKKSTITTGYKRGISVDSKSLSETFDMENKNVFKKGGDLKINVVNSTEDERKIYEEFQKLEAKVDKIIAPLKSITTSRKEGNTKHNRYTDIGTTYN